MDDIRILYDELISFKDDEIFHIVGFWVKYKYKAWQIKVENIRKKSNLSIEEKIAIGDLLTLGLEYIKTKGKENDYTIFICEEINNG